MEKNILEIFIKKCGTVEKAAKIIGITRETLSAIRNGRSEIKVEDAASIAEYINLHTDKKVHFLDLISDYKKNKLKRVPSGFSYLPFNLKKMLLNDVKHYTKTAYISEELSDLDKARPIIVDENNQLIGNPITYFLHIQDYTKPMIFAWKISLFDLFNNKYETSDLISIFDEIERGYIGIALGNFMGNRQGQRTDLLKNKSESGDELRLKLDEVTGRTDQKIANLLGLTRTQFWQLKKIILHCSDELIEKVRTKQITISAAAKCIPFNER